MVNRQASKRKVESPVIELQKKAKMAQFEKGIIINYLCDGQSAPSGSLQMIQIREE